MAPPYTNFLGGPVFWGQVTKSAINKMKHGLDFEQVKALWEDDNLLEVPVLRTGEPRFLVIGMIEGKVWTGVIAYRGEVVRIISVHRSRKEEVEHYES